MFFIKYIFVFLPIILFFSISCKQESPTDNNPIKEEFHTGMVVGRMVFEEYDQQLKTIFYTPRSDYPIAIGHLNPFEVLVSVRTNTDGYYQANEVPIGLVDVWDESNRYANIKNLIVNENIVTTVPDLQYHGSYVTFFGNIIETVPSSTVQAFYDLELDSNRRPINDGKNPMWEYFANHWLFTTDSLDKFYEARYITYINREEKNICLNWRYQLMQKWIVLWFSNHHNVYNLDLDFTFSGNVKEIYLQ